MISGVCNGLAAYFNIDPTFVRVAFVLMALSTLAGAMVAKRGNLVSIAVLSLLGGNLAPIILHSATPDLPRTA